MTKSFEDSFDIFMKSIDKSKNRLELITDKNGTVRRVWKNIETGNKVDAGKNAGKAYEKTGQRHTEYNGFNSGDIVNLTVAGKEIKGTFRHVNQSKHSVVAVIRGEDNKLYERGMSKIKKFEEQSGGKTKVIKTAGVQPKVQQKSTQQSKPNKVVGNQIAFVETKLNIADKKSKNETKLSKEHIIQIQDKYNSTLDKLHDILNSPPKGDMGMIDKSGLNAKQLKEYNDADAKYKEVFKKFRDFNATIPKDIARDIAMEKRFKKKPQDLKEVSKKPLKTSGVNDSTDFITESKKTTYQRGDSVTFIDNDGREKTGRVLKIDSLINMTSIRLPSGITKTVSNKKINQ